jgi:1-phosphatidylinositol-4-phosphate 5-kinase
MGHFFEGRYHGTGELRNSKNVIYIGEFKNDFKEGKGVEMIMKRKKNPTKGEQTLIRKSMYNGEFKEGFRCGVGIEETTHAVYNGEWKGGVKSGKGEMIYKNGDKYDGSWENN